MRTLSHALLATLILAGCTRPPTIEHTDFFNAHDVQAELDTLAKQGGHNVSGGSSSLAHGRVTGERDYQISIEGTATIRDELLQKYKEIVERAIKQSGASISGRGESGSISGFDFNYQNSTVTGIVRVTSCIGADGHIQIDAFLYEHL